MVGRGEILERMTTINGPHGVLEGLWQAGGVGVAHRAPVLVCPPHPRLGGSMDTTVCAELVWQLARRHHPTLRFNYAGVSASEGELGLPWLPWQPSPSSSSATPSSVTPPTLAPLIDDARAALAQLKHSTGEDVVVIVGVSIGALVAAELFLQDPGASALGMVAPPLRGVLGPDDAIDIAALKATGFPVVVVVGDADRFVDAAAVAAACRGLSVRQIEGADHGFSRGLTAAARAVVEVVSVGGDDDDDDED
jgi:alpha/beta superfamily hydrolase